MANFVTIEAEARERSGKGAARATRRAGKVPAVIYGARQAPTLISLEPRAVLREIGRSGWRSRLYDVQVGGQSTRALIRDVQFHPVSDLPEHVDFQRLAPGEMIRVMVRVAYLNEGVSPGLKRGGVLNVVRHAVEVLCDPEAVPEKFEVDLGGLDIGANVRFHDLTGTEGTRPTILGRDFVVATIAPPTKAPEPAADAAAPGAPTAAPAVAKGAAAPAKAAPAKGAAPAAKPAGKAPAKKG